MSSPPSWFVSEMAVFLDVKAVESAVLDLRPDFAGSIHEPEVGRPLLSFDVADHHRVVVGLVRGGKSGRSPMRAWMIEDGRPGNRASWWPRGTRSGVLAEAVVARIDAVVRKGNPAES